MPPRAWLTPETLPDGYDCRAMFLPIGRDWEAIVRGALLLLSDSYNFEQLPGHLTAEETAAIFGVTFDAWLIEDCPMFPGMVVAGANPTSPSAKWLKCDGTAYNQADYPALYAAIGVTFGVGGDSTFRVPDLAGRLPVGVGSGPGLTPRALAASGGEEAHVLTVAELASHYHSISALYPGAVQSGTGQNSWVYNGAQVKNTLTQGSNTAHNTMPPFLALNFFIYTG